MYWLFCYTILLGSPSGDTFLFWLLYYFFSSKIPIWFFYILYFFAETFYLSIHFKNDHLYFLEHLHNSHLKVIIPGLPW